MKTIKLELKQNIFEELVGDIKRALQVELENFKVSFTQLKNEEMFYSLEETAEILGITKQTLYTMNSKNEIPYCKRGKKCFYLKVDIMNYIQEGRIKSRTEVENETINSLIKERKNK
jgi:excisionase family DNA binding protein